MRGKSGAAHPKKALRGAQRTLSNVLIESLARVGERPPSRLKGLRPESSATRRMVAFLGRRSAISTGESPSTQANRASASPERSGRDWRFTGRIVHDFHTFSNQTSGSMNALTRPTDRASGTGAIEPVDAWTADCDESSTTPHFGYFPSRLCTSASESSISASRS